MGIRMGGVGIRMEEGGNEDGERPGYGAHPHSQTSPHLRSFCAGTGMKSSANKGLNAESMRYAASVYLLNGSEVSNVEKRSRKLESEAKHSPHKPTTANLSKCPGRFCLACRCLDDRSWS